MQEERAEIPDLPWSIFPEKQQASATCLLCHPFSLGTLFYLLPLPWQQTSQTTQLHNSGKWWQLQSRARYQGPSHTCPTAMASVSWTCALWAKSLPTGPSTAPPAAEWTNINNLFAITSVSDTYSLGLLIQKLNNACMAFRPHKCHLELNSVINSTLPVKCILNLLHLSLHLVLKRKKNGSSILSKKISTGALKGCVALPMIYMDFWPGFRTGWFRDFT